MNELVKAKNGLQVFENEKFGKVRVVTRDGEPWFVATDVAVALGYANPQEATRDHCKKVNKITQPSESLGAPPISFNVIPESDLYRLIMRSNLPAAAEFQDWVCDDVLPSIRQNGGYMLMRPDETEEEFFVRAALLAQQVLARMEAEKKQLLVKVENIEVELDESKLWWSIKRVAAVARENWREYNWRALRSASFSLGLPPRKIFDANFGAVNVYHIDAFEQVYPGIRAYLMGVK